VERRWKLALAIAVVVGLPGVVPDDSPVVRSRTEEGLWTELAIGPFGGPGSGMAYDSQSDRTIVFAQGETFALNRAASKWVKLDTSPRPQAMGLLTYDSESDRSVLFGGGSGRETWAFDLDRNAWTNVTGEPAPGVHRRGSLVYDSQSDRVILFGGGDASPTNDTWSFDLNTNTWTDMNPAVRPPARSLAAGAYDPQSDRTIVCGGLTGSGSAQDRWAYDFENNTWSLLDGTSCGFYGHTMSYDTRRGQMVLYTGGGGFGSSNVYVYDSVAGSWMLLNRTRVPMGRTEPSVAYDAVADKLILFGGELGLDDSWAYDFSTDRWDLISWGTPPQNLHGLAYDSQSDRTLLVGGLGCGDRTWAYDLQADAWTNMRPELQYWTGSPTRSVVYHSSLDRVICFDGRTLAYDFETNIWTDMHANPPSPWSNPGQSGFAMAYDTESDRVILTGGVSNPGGAMRGTWAFDSAVWRNMNPEPSPPGRTSFAIAYDSESDRVVLFGGEADAFTILGDTWTYDVNENRWLNMSPAGGPFARKSAAATYDAQSDRTIMFGGTNAVGVPLNDTWAYDLNTNTWTNLTSPVNPSWRYYGHFMAYDSNADRVILFGGSPAAAASRLTWGFEVGVLPRTPTSPGAPLDLTYLIIAIAGGLALFSAVLLLSAWRKTRRPPVS